MQNDSEEPAAKRPRHTRRKRETADEQYARALSMLNNINLTHTPVEERIQNAIEFGKSLWEKELSLQSLQNHNRTNGRRNVASAGDGLNDNNEREHDEGENSATGDQALGKQRARSKTREAADDRAEEKEFGRFTFEMPGTNDEITLAELLNGQDWENKIQNLYDVPPMEVPPNMTIRPHDYQLKGAAQLHSLCEGDARGGILADSMGLGKTLTAILAMNLVRDVPGMCVVVAPKTLCPQWVTSIERTFTGENRLSAYLVHSAASVTAHDLFASGADVVVVGYEQLQAAGRDLQTISKKLQKYANDTTNNVKMPNKAHAPFHSRLWVKIGEPFKRVILDEGQVVNKRGGERHQAIKRLPACAIITLTGTPAHNKWHNFSGLIDFLGGHPFITHQLFMEAFSSFAEEFSVDRPCHDRLPLLHRFLQRYVICRPRDILKLPSCNSDEGSFKVDDESAGCISELMSQYFDAINDSFADKIHRFIYDTSAGAESLGLLIKAQAHSAHPILVAYSESTDTKEKDDASDPKDASSDTPLENYVTDINSLLSDNGFAVESESKKSRYDWLKYLKSLSLEDLMNSERVKLFFTQYDHMRKKHPKAKPVVFSIFLRFLDILARIFELKYRIKAFRYDGTVPQGMRSVVETEYAEATAGVPLLLTATCGGYGLNIVSANYVFQCEPWWTSSLERQALSRCHRQGQRQIVYHKLFHAKNSEVDKFIMQTRDAKDEVNELVLQPLIRGLGEGPANLDFRVSPCHYKYQPRLQDQMERESGSTFPEFVSMIQRELEEDDAKDVTDAWAAPGAHIITEGSESNMLLDSSTSHLHPAGSSHDVEDFHDTEEQGGPSEAAIGHKDDEVGEDTPGHQDHDDMMDLDHDEHMEKDLEIRDLT